MSGVFYIEQLYMSLIYKISKALHVGRVSNAVPGSGDFDIAGIFNLVDGGRHFLRVFAVLQNVPLLDSVLVTVEALKFRSLRSNEAVRILGGD